MSSADRFLAGGARETALDDYTRPTGGWLA